MGLLCLAALGVGLIGGVTMRYIFNAGSAQREGSIYALASLLLVFSFLGLFVMAMAGGFYLLYQFYRRKFTDEGYLTFTLPASAWEIFLSSLLNVMIWSLATGVALILAFCLIFFIGLASSEFLREMRLVFAEMRYIFGPEFRASMPRASLPLMISLYIVQFFGTNIVSLTCITLGSILARRRKLLGAIGAYWCYSMLSGAITSQFLTPFLVGDHFSLNAYFGVMLAYMLIVSVGGFFLSTWLMDRKLNLP